MTTEVQCTWAEPHRPNRRCISPAGHGGEHRPARPGDADHWDFTPGTRLELTGSGTVVEGLNGRLDLLTKPGGALLDLALLTGPGGFKAEPARRVPGTPLTVDDMVRPDSPLEQRLRELFPPQSPATGWKHARQWLDDRVSNARTRLALTIAPWLEIR